MITFYYQTLHNITTSNLSLFIFDSLVKSHVSSLFVIPAKAGIQLFKHVLDSRLRESDRNFDFLRNRHI